MDVPALFRDKELAFLRELNTRGVRYLVVGLSAAALQGAPTATVDVDLWVEDLEDPGFRSALHRVGGAYVAPTGATPPILAGESVALFDLVTHMSGLRSFAEEFSGARCVDVAGLEVPVLPLERIIASKRAARRPKDLAAAGTRGGASGRRCLSRQSAAAAASTPFWKILMPSPSAGREPSSFLRVHCGWWNG